MLMSAGCIYSDYSCCSSHALFHHVPSYFVSYVYIRIDLLCSLLYSKCVETASTH